ncbi:hypothetical protein LIG30_0798 [Burkholderia sp. lig30]|uniref:hypothetical protein n=1 Tax=Burkholderia sp. lig30 TaxID=1192124 RepID=UPI000461659A|nr:hypothetical protein [Burkholderia sp. lig30]KDB10269.1 hypothetical protein LIG30_0798 [Burkholderia sp. lig30]
MASTPSDVDKASNEKELDRVKWEAEKAFRDREVSVQEKAQSTQEAQLDLQRKEQAASRWRSPLVVAILAAAAAAGGNAILAYTNAHLQRAADSQKSEQARILEMIKTDNPDKAAENLQFLLDSGLISEPSTVAKLSTYLKNRKQGSGAALPAAGGAAPPETTNLINQLEGITSATASGAKFADELSLRTKLARAIITYAVVQGGISRARRIAEMTTANLKGSPATGIDEKTWINEYMNVEAQTGSEFVRQVQSRSILKFQDLVRKNDWDLKNYSPDAP